MEENKKNENIVDNKLEEKETESIESAINEVKEEVETKETEVVEEIVEEVENIDSVINEDVTSNIVDVNAANSTNNGANNSSIINEKIDVIFEKGKNFVYKNKLVSAVLLTSVCFNIYQLSLNTTAGDMHEEKIQELNNLIDKKNKEINEKNTEIESLGDTLSKNYTTITSLNKKVADAKPWLELSETQKELIKYNIADIENKKEEEIEAQVQALKEAEEKKLEEERLAREKAEEEERKAQEKAEKEKYNTGITYKQLARNPEDYKHVYCKFKGKVLQVMEGAIFNQMRIAVNGNYDNVLYVTYNPTDLDSRILEDDNITVYGKSTGIYSYKSILGATISIPSLRADKVEM